MPSKPQALKEKGLLGLSDLIMEFDYFFSYLIRLISYFKLSIPTTFWSGLLILDKVEGNKVHCIVLRLDFATVFSLLLILKGSACCGLLSPEGVNDSKVL